MKKRRSDPQIDTGMFADVSFLLMIFFMVVTTFHKQYSLDLSLPPSQENKIKHAVNADRVLTILINMNDEYLIEDKPIVNIAEIEISDEILRIGSHEKIGIVRLVMDPLTSYSAYLEALALLKRGKKLARETLSINNYNAAYYSLNEDDRRDINNSTSFKLTELESK